MEITKQTARRYLLGRQGLWPGRRWLGKEGAATAIRRLGAVQIDPLNVVGRSHDLVLWSRVIDYRQEHLDTLLYQDREFFDYGGLLFIYPMEELPYWRLHMRRRAADARWSAVARQHAAAIEEVRAELRARGPLGNRDFAGNARVESYRARKDTGIALYYLWLTGELMTHSRRNFQRLFGFREEIAPPSLAEVSEAETEQFFARRALERSGLATATTWATGVAYPLAHRPGRTEARRWLSGLVAEGVAAEVRVEDVREPYYAPAAELPLLEQIAAGHLPEGWQPVDTTTEDEVVFLAPLDGVLHRQRTQAVFDFEYIWEVYKPAPLRRWGYYTLPVLWSDRLVARIDPKLDRKTRTLAINGFWLEDETLADNPAFAMALGRGLVRLLDFLDAGSLTFSVDLRGLREGIEAAVALAECRDQDAS